MTISKKVLADRCQGDIINGSDVRRNEDDGVDDDLINDGDEDDYNGNIDCVNESDNEKEDFQTQMQMQMES